MGVLAVRIPHCQTMGESIDLSLTNLSHDPSFDFHTLFNNNDSNFNSPMGTNNFDCSYLNEIDFVNDFAGCKDLIICSINIQSISAKFGKLNELIHILNKGNCGPDIICLQELWRFPDSTSFNLPDYHPLIYKLRHNNIQGGGVGIFVKKIAQLHNTRRKISLRE